MFFSQNNIENLKHEKTAEIVLSEFKNRLAYYFKTNSTWAKDVANALEAILVKIGYSKSELEEIVNQVENEVSNSKTKLL